ncbi:Cell division protein FtsY homolog [Urinicoccus massiliensis]|uniref:Signal recognition particle receptor FtsY n=1 Tax=Urinicoccus massiliensis TaxID=1723382 RepID=A0A8H2M5D8_9FIRM|nr:signal recognition particle-docking protein FtsY [Urinicoccus massiliensis]VFB16426.1 Cell division protein FtsY homolog [Urinicoccus massiliensis]
MFEWIKDKLKGTKEKEEDLSTGSPLEDKENNTEEFSQEEGVILGKSLEEALLEKAVDPIDDSEMVNNYLEVDHEGLVVKSEEEDSLESLERELEKDFDEEIQEDPEEELLNLEAKGREKSPEQLVNEKIEGFEPQEGNQTLEDRQEEEKIEDQPLEISKPEEEAEEVVEEVKEETGGFFQKLKSGLSKTRKQMSQKINQVLGVYVKIDDDLIDDLEDVLISSDMGMETTMEAIDRLRDKIIEDEIKDPQAIYPALKEVIQELLDECKLNVELETDSPTIILVVGVNGVGKTTTIGKLSAQLKGQGKNVLIAAADTFRAAAIDQVKTWGTRANVEVVSHSEGADPAAVTYDAIQAAKARNTDVLIIDTAGRLHNKANLMKELEKISRIIEREYPEAKRENLLVLDATTGQNAILQAKTFNEATNLTGFILTKLDGTAKGGVVIGLQRELNVPIKFIGVGEQINDLQVFDSEKFVEALFEDEVEM